MPELLQEGFVSLIDGVQGGIKPTLLSPSQFAQGLNVSVRDGFLRTRPQFKKVGVLGTGIFKGAGVYSLNSGDRIVYGIDGTLYSWKLGTGELGAVELGNFDASADRIYTVQADRYFVVQDGVSRPLFVEEDTLLREAKPYGAFDPDDPETKNEVFTGTIMEYGHGRIFVRANEIHDNTGQPITGAQGKPYFVAGDIIKPNDPEEVLNFSETTYLAGGGAAGQPAEFGFITGMELFRNAPTGSGQGPLIIFSRGGVSSFAVNTPRSNWQALDFSQVFFTDVGTESDLSIIPVNDDILFRGHDGIRTIRYTATQLAGGAGSLSVTPISYEVTHRLELDEDEDLPDVSSSFARNFILMTTGGKYPGSDAFRSIVSLDTAPAYSLTSRAQPVFVDIWTGLHFLQTLSARDKFVRNHYFIVQNGDDVELWTMDDTATVDGEASNTLCRAYTRGFTFESSSFSKTFSHMKLWIRDLVGEGRITAYWRPDGYQLWNKMTDVQLCAPEADGSVPQHRYQVRLSPETDQIWDPSTGNNVLVGSSFQFCIEWEGVLSLEKVAFYAYPEMEEPELTCSQEELDCEALTEGDGGVILDDFIYEIEA